MMRPITADICKDIKMMNTNFFIVNRLLNNNFYYFCKLLRI